MELNWFVHANSGEPLKGYTARPQDILYRLIRDAWPMSNDDLVDFIRGVNPPLIASIKRLQQCRCVPVRGLVATED